MLLFWHYSSFTQNNNLVEKLSRFWFDLSNYKMSILIWNKETWLPMRQLFIRDQRKRMCTTSLYHTTCNLQHREKSIPCTVNSSIIVRFSLRWIMWLGECCNNTNFHSDIWCLHLYAYSLKITIMNHTFLYIIEKLQW